MESNIFKERILILTENIDGDLYTISTMKLLQKEVETNECYKIQL